jgi:hypothetical protein
MDKNKEGILGKHILTDPMVIPVNDVMEKLLGERYNLYKEFVEKINEKKLILGWGYYDEKKAWVGEIAGEWKHIPAESWLNITDAGFEVDLGIYIKEQLVQIFELGLINNLKLKTMKTKPFKKYNRQLYRIKISFEDKETLNDVIQLLEHRCGTPAKEAQNPNQMVPKIIKMELSGELEIFSSYTKEYGRLIYTNKGNKTVEIEIQIADFASKWYNGPQLQDFICFLFDHLKYEKVLLNTKKHFTRLQKLYESKGFVNTKTENNIIYYELTKEAFKKKHYPNIQKIYTELISKESKAL